jgi:cellulose synthase/poly-beta-1,6-N-acetylglucosamine synthase-like glycosyltransferase
VHPIEAVFWISFTLIAYVYVGYPLVLGAWSRLRRRPVHRADWEPTVSLILAVRNERDTIADKIENCELLDYPPEKLQIVVSLDAPTDGTDHIVYGCSHPLVRVVSCARHEGKAAALNRAVRAANGEVLVFCDARQRIEPGAIRELLEDLADPTVGAVTGELMLSEDGSHETADGVGLYWRYEKALRSMESSIHSTVGATGALYAVRRELFAPIPESAVLDDVIVPMRIVLGGKRTVFEPRARVWDRVAPPEQEFLRKVRTLAGNFQLFELMPDLLSPGRNPVFLQFVSHKVGRLLVPYLLVTLFVSNLMLRGGFYTLFLVCQISWYLLAAAGALSRRHSMAEAPTSPTTRKADHDDQTTDHGPLHLRPDELGRHDGLVPFSPQSRAGGRLDRRPASARADGPASLAPDEALTAGEPWRVRVSS